MSSNSGGDELANVMFSYSSNINELEEENKILKETINHLKNEMDRFRTPPLMMCEVREIVNNNAIIKVPNGNQFFVCIKIAFVKFSYFFRACFWRYNYL